jgi:uncharacterized membrane protein
MCDGDAASRQCKDHHIITTLQMGELGAKHSTRVPAVLVCFIFPKAWHRGCLASQTKPRLNCKEDTTMLQDRGAMLTGLGLGLGLMYFFDPERGRRRRALVRDQTAHAARLTRDRTTVGDEEPGNWSPTTRMMVGSSGAALAALGASRRTLPGAFLAAAGVGLLARAATNADMRRLTGIGPRLRAVDIRRTITIDAPVEEVFRFWTAYENFPRFMSNVRDVRPSSRERQSHWTVAGPAGIPVEFDAEVSEFVPNEVFAWRTVEASPVAHAGIVRFDPAVDGGTRVDIRMSYNPPGGWIGHGVAAAFGVDPESSLHADLTRMKALIERGHRPHDAAQRGAGFLA